MNPVPANRDAIATRGLEVAGKWGHRNGVEMGTASHGPAPFFASI
jgi:hypothetical protein